MIQIFKSSYRISLIYSILFIIVGATLFFAPLSFTMVVSYILGGIILTMGVSKIISYIQTKKMPFSKTLLVVGILFSVIGLFLIINPTFIGTIVPVIIGFCLIINSTEKLVTLRYLNEEGEAYIVSLVSGIVALLAGIFLLFNPLSGTAIITQVVGVIIIVYSVMDLIEKIRFKNLFKEPKKSKKETIKIIDEK